MKPYLPCKLKSGKRMNPKPRRPPRVYQSDHHGGFDDDVRSHEVFIAFLAIFATLSFATLCAVIA
jgi:hypothetical protein